MPTHSSLLLFFWFALLVLRVAHRPQNTPNRAVTAEGCVMFALWAQRRVPRQASVLKRELLPNWSLSRDVLRDNVAFQTQLAKSITSWMFRNRTFPFWLSKRDLRELLHDFEFFSFLVHRMSYWDLEIRILQRVSRWAGSDIFRSQQGLWYFELVLKCSREMYELRARTFRTMITNPFFCTERFCCALSGGR